MEMLVRAERKEMSKKIKISIIYHKNHNTISAADVNAVHSFSFVLSCVVSEL